MRLIKIGCEKVKKASGTGKKPVHLSRWLTGVFETYEYQECTFGEVQNAQMTVISEGPEAAG